MNQNIWGSHLWFSLHTMSFNYPLEPTKEDKESYKRFFVNLRDVIPCSVCKKNYIRHLNEHPIDGYLKNRKSLVYWVIDMHNMVNGEIGKKILSYDIVIKKYENVYGKKFKLNSESNSELESNSESEYNSESKLNYINKYSKIIYGFIILFLLLIIINYIYFLLKCKKC